MLSVVCQYFMFSLWAAHWRCSCFLFTEHFPDNFLSLGLGLHHGEEPYKFPRSSGIPLKRSSSFYGATASLILKTVTLFHLAFAPLEEPLQDSGRFGATASLILPFTYGTPTRFRATGLPLQGRVRLWGHCISNTKDCDSTLHLAFAPLENP
ncbi:hypothetical protein TNIN_411201 [Trichonephila inaurata madagascariensis]|uniref:Secreted protein n=1 Tax=Trichonephila inaurata madagascariensis TaxID=2747483 RepID=A0A8X6XGV6_9ARAC|nr:hypothetical protein TNIN_411201 [Trichonephila inaurata madagascariensis]